MTTMLHVQFWLASRRATGQHRHYSCRYIYIYIHTRIYVYIFEQISRNEQLKHKKKKQRQQSWPFKVSPPPLYSRLSPSFLRPFQLLHGPTAISLNDAVNVQCLRRLCQTNETIRCDLELVHTDIFPDISQETTAFWAP